MGILDQANTGLDPRLQGLLAAAAQGLQSSGPSPMPQSLGQIIGQGLQSGLAGYGTGMKNMQQQQLIELEKKKAALADAQIAKMQADAEFQKSMIGVDMNDPVKMRAAGMKLAIGGHAGGAQLIAQAEKLEKDQQQAATLESYKRSPGMLGAGVTATSQQGQQLLGQATGDPSFDSALLSLTNSALNSAPGAKAVPVSPPRAGLFDPLVNSPFPSVRDSANNFQTALQTAKGADPDHFLKLLAQLQTQNTAEIGKQTARDDITARAKETRELIGAQQENNIRLAASLRPPHAEPAVTIIYEPNGKGGLIAKDARTGRVLSENATTSGIQTQENRPDAVQPIYEKNGKGGYRSIDARTGRTLSEDAVPPGVAGADIRHDNSRASQIQTRLSGVVKPQIESLNNIQVYRDIRDSGGDTAQAAEIAGELVRRAARSGNARFKGEAEKMLGNGYGSGNLADRLSNFVSKELSGPPTKETMAKLDKLMDTIETSQFENIARNYSFYASQAKGNKIDLRKAIGDPFVQGRNAVMPDGTHIRSNAKDPGAANAEILEAVRKWNEANP